MTLEQLKERLRDRRPAVVAEATGLHALTIARIRDGSTKPSYDTLIKIQKYLELN